VTGAAEFDEGKPLDGGQPLPLQRAEAGLNVLELGLERSWDLARVKPGRIGVDGKLAGRGVGVLQNQGLEGCAIGCNLDRGVAGEVHEGVALVGRKLMPVAEFKFDAAGVEFIAHLHGDAAQARYKIGFKLEVDIFKHNFGQQTEIDHGQA